MTENTKISQLEIMADCTTIDYLSHRIVLPNPGPKLIKDYVQRIFKMIQWYKPNEMVKGVYFGASLYVTCSVRNVSQVRLSVIVL